MIRTRFGIPQPTPTEAAAARELCRLRGYSPDEKVQHGPLDGSGYAISLTSARWVLAADEIDRHLTVHDAMRFAGLS